MECEPAKTFTYLCSSQAAKACTHLCFLFIVFFSLFSVFSFPWKLLLVTDVHVRQKHDSLQHAQLLL